METLSILIGRFILCFGGICACIGLACLLGWLVSFAWIAFSETFRGICKAESLIYEYRKNREQFLKWKEKKDGN